MNKTFIGFIGLAVVSLFGFGWLWHRQDKMRQDIDNTNEKLIGTLYDIQSKNEVNRMELDLLRANMREFDKKYGI
jgi:hypothetical protein